MTKRKTLWEKTYEDYTKDRPSTRLAHEKAIEDAKKPNKSSKSFYVPLSDDNSSIAKDIRRRMAEGKV